MKKPTVILLMALSADGYITKHEDGLVNWSSKEDKKYFVEITKKAGALIYGNSTFETFKKPLPGRLNIVMTRTPDAAKNIDGELEFTNASPQEILNRLGEKGYEEVILTGGASINTLFFSQNLVDEVHLTIEPFLFGSGKRLTESTPFDISMTLQEHRTLNENTLLLKYRVNR